MSEGSQPPTRCGITRNEREQILLDDLRFEVARLADAVERQNELLSESEIMDEVDR